MRRNRSHPPGFPRTELEGLDPLPATWDEMVDQIGNTPLATVPVRLGKRQWALRIKLEGRNPLGSIKDRTAYGLIQSAETDRRASEPLTIVESSSGNLGAALAALCRLRGHSFIAVVDPKASPLNLAIMRRFDAQIEVADRSDETGSYLGDRIARVRRICSRKPEAYWTNQYANPANPKIHYEQTGPEIVRQSGQDLDCVFVAVSTGGTIAGIARYLRTALPASVRVIGVDAKGSIALGDRPSPRRLTGYGASRRCNFVGAGDLDGVLWVDDAEVLAICRKLEDEAGLFLGGSSGAAVAGCVRYLRRHREVRRPLCVSADDGFKYRESIYDPDWAGAKRIDVASAMRKFERLGLAFSQASFSMTGDTYADLGP